VPRFAHNKRQTNGITNCVQLAGKHHRWRQGTAREERRKDGAQAHRGTRPVTDDVSDGDGKAEGKITDDDRRCSSSSCSSRAAAHDAACTTRADRLIILAFTTVVYERPTHAIRPLLIVTRITSESSAHRRVVYYLSRTDGHTQSLFRAYSSETPLRVLV